MDGDTTEIENMEVKVMRFETSLHGNHKDAKVFITTDMACTMICTRM